MRNHIIVVEFSISEANGASETPFVLLAFPMLSQPGEKRYSIPLQTCDFSENHSNIIEVI